jgi:DNA-binding transcriptional LysR family regulator
MLNEISIKCFLSVAKHLSFTKAAEEVFMTRQAVSNKILALEKRLGVKLFDRTTNVIELTEDGRKYLEFFQGWVEEFTSFSESMGKQHGQEFPLLIGYEQGMIIDDKLIEAMGEYKCKHPHTNLNIQRYDPLVIETKLFHGTLDIVFTTIPKDGKIYNEYDFIILEYAEYVVATSKNHPKVGDGTKFTDFNGEAAVYWGMENADDVFCRKKFNAAWVDIGITLVPTIECVSLSSAYTELILGNAVLPCHAKNEICSMPGILTFPLPKHEIFGGAWSKTAAPEVKDFAETALRKCAMQEG